MLWRRREQLIDFGTQIAAYLRHSGALSSSSNMVNPYFLSWIMILLTLSSLPSSTRAQVEITTPEQLDLLIRDSTFKSISSMRKIKTGEIYNVNLPANLSGITAHAGRFRCGSLKRYGARFEQIGLRRAGITLLPCLVRVMVITQNLGLNWSSIYTSNYDLSGYRLVSPILGLKAYDYNPSWGNSSSPNSSYPFEIAIGSSQGNSITINFSSTDNGNKNPLCAIFEKDGKVSMKPPVSPQVCASTSNGHYGLVVPLPPLSTPPAPSPRPATAAGGGKGRSHKKVWVVVGSVVGGVVVGLLIFLLLVTCVKVKKKAKIAEMERRAYEEEALDVSVVGNVRAPVASGTRTVPTIEHEFIPHNPS
ncbi:hypothetical protein LINPERPRIM_LOCUS5752 [Linum perenne]